MANSEDPEQTALIRAVCSGSKLFASILNLSVIIGNYLQQTTSADYIFRWIFSLKIFSHFPLLPGHLPAFFSGNGSPSKYVMELMVNGNLTTYLFKNGSNITLTTRLGFLIDIAQVSRC